MNIFPHPDAIPGNPDAPGGPDKGSPSGEDRFVAEREALARILDSGEFQRSPNLEKILTYLCTQFFLGKSHLVKEYSIATEACNRRGDFDPKQDAIVRVEMHRLRKRLKEYYDSRGAADLLRISIPTKSYVPEFEKLASPMVASGLISEAIEEVPEEGIEQYQPLVEASGPTRRKPASFWVMVLALIFGLSFAAFKLLPGSNKVAQDKKSPEVASAAAVVPPVLATDPVVTNEADQTVGLSEIRILAGRPKGRYPDRYGVVWQGDDYYRGGSAVAVESKVHSRGFDSNLFSNMREGDFFYDIPLRQASYEMLLLFAETTFGEGNSLGGDESPRSFHVVVNNNTVISNLEVMADAHDVNASTAKLLKDVRPDKDGKLHLHFQSTLSGKAFVNAIVIRPGIVGKIKPIRIVCRPNLYRDSDNNIWEPDHFFRGGVQITRPTGSSALPKDPDLVKGERYGKFSYTIPVPPGKYQARFYFTEYWFGADRPGKGGVGSRVFDVFCNFRPLLTNFDILQRDSKNPSIVETFHGLVPNLDSKLIFEFAPKVNYAMLNALEIAEDDAVLGSH